MNRLFFPTALVATLGGSLFAQDSFPPRPVTLHATIITVGHQIRTGFLYDITDSALVLSDKKGFPRGFDSSGREGLSSIGYRDLRYAEFSPKGQVWVTTLIGLGIGAAIGAIAGYANGDDPKEDWFAITAGQKAGYGAIVGGVTGAVTGLIVGMAVRRSFLVRGRRENFTRMKRKMAVRLGL